MNEQPKGIVICKLNVLLMPNGEIICNGKTLGWFEDLKEFLTEESEEGA